MKHNTWIYLFTIILKLKIQNACEFSNVHVTLGDYFADKNSPIIYVIGFMANDNNCMDIELHLKYPNEPVVQKFNSPKMRPYIFNDVYHTFKEDIKVEYIRSFYFIELLYLKNNEEFEYQFIVNSKPIKTPYKFRSKVFSGQNLRIASFGDHDHSTEGIKTINRLEKMEVDLLILLGDFAYEIYLDNGKFGDEYFQKMETIMSRNPCVLTPGNHENIDNTLFLNTRFRMPGTVEAMDNNLYSFQIGDVLFFSFNFDLILEIFPDEDNYINKVAQFLHERNKTSENVKWRVFFSHRPIYCSQFDIPKLGCAASPFYLKQYEDLLDKFGVDIYLFAHIHNYERYAPMLGYQLKEERNKLILVSGSAGNAQFFKPVEPFPVMFLEKFISGVAGFSVLEKKGNEIEVTYVQSDNGSVLDRTKLSIALKTKNKWILLGLFVFSVWFTFFWIIYGKKKVEPPVEFKEIGVKNPLTI